MTLAQRLYHLSQGIKSTDILNAPTNNTQAMPSADIAAELNAMMRRLKAGAMHEGRVDYGRVRGFMSDFRSVTQALHHFELTQLQTREEKLAFWINLYNALVIDGVIHYNIRQRVQEVHGFFSKIAYTIGGYRFSADDIEHGILRANVGHPAIPGPQFAASDPRASFALQKQDHRIHFTLVCAATSCPPINTYSADRIDAQLDLAAGNFVNGGGFVVDLAHKTIHLSKIFMWYAPDFGGSMLNQLGPGDFSAVMRTVGQYLVESPEKTAVLEHPQDFRVKFRQYDWSLNLL